MRDDLERLLVKLQPLLKSADPDATAADVDPSLDSELAVEDDGENTTRIYLRDSTSEEGISVSTFPASENRPLQYPHDLPFLRHATATLYELRFGAHVLRTLSWEGAGTVERAAQHLLASQFAAGWSHATTQEPPTMPAPMSATVLATLQRQGRTRTFFVASTHPDHGQTLGMFELRGTTTDAST